MDGVYVDLDQENALKLAANLMKVFGKTVLVIADDDNAKVV